MILGNSPTFVHGVLRKVNCEVVTSDIDKFVENGIVGKDGKLTELDAVIFCTGFRTQEFLCSLPEGVIGKKGKHLQKDVWDNDNCFAYLGVTVTDFPNLFMLYGPGTNLGHNSVLFMIECAVEYTMQSIELMMKNWWSEMDVKQDVMDKFVKRLDAENEKNAWQATGVNNWYKNAKGRGSTNWAWNCNYYWWLTRKVNAADYNVKSL